MGTQLLSDSTPSGGASLSSRIVVAFKKGEMDPLGSSLEKSVGRFLNIHAQSIRTRRVYTINAEISKNEADSLAANLFVDPVTECRAKDSDNGFDWIVEVGYKPGVTDPVGKTASSAAREILGSKAEYGIGTATQYLVKGVGREAIDRMVNELLVNPLIENVRVFSREEVHASGIKALHYELGGRAVPQVGVRDLNVSDDELVGISRKGVLSLSLGEMKTIQKHTQSMQFTESRKKIGMPQEFLNKLTDAELEVIAQTQSEHCKHKIFNGNIRYSEDGGQEEEINGLFGTYIKAPTERMLAQYPWILSAFSDNAGIVDFGNGMLIADKAETHNAPSALDPYGGAITGILGVNRDVLGAGLGAKPILNIFGYCFGNPFYSGELKGGILHPSRIRNGVHRGVIDGGNQSGIPLADGFEIFDDRYGFRPLVYCGTIGIMPKSILGRSSYVKKAEPGDAVVMVGGRIGKDGIHGNTFASEALTSNSPVQAVQIGDSITQKVMADFLIEARDLGLYRSITDNGAGGLSSSVGEMAKDTGGCTMDLEKAPLKYSGLEPWEILVSESQERMTLAVEPAKVDELVKLAAKRGVEATVIGEFNGSGMFHVKYGQMTVAYLDMGFLHGGFPKMDMEAQWKTVLHDEPDFKSPEKLDGTLKEMLARLNICSKEYRMRQYDHEVKALSVVKPFVGKDLDTPSDATVSIIRPGSTEGIVVARGMNPYYSDIDTYHMTASVIDEAIRRAVAVGAKLPSNKDIMYALDNFCWNLAAVDSDEGKLKMGQLVRSNRALAEYCEAFGVPCISGKDSMKNVWKLKEKLGDKEIEKVISIPPTLLFSVRAKMEDVSRAVTMDAKKDGDIVYAVGMTYDELGASEYFAYMGEKARGTPYIGNRVPKVDAHRAKETYSALGRAVETGCIASAHTPTIGGLGVAAAQSAFAGGLGMEMDLAKVPYSGQGRDDYIMFSQSNSRFIVTVPPERKREFEDIMKGTVFAEVGRIDGSGMLRVKGLSGAYVIDSDLAMLKDAWKRTLEGV